MTKVAIHESRIQAILSTTNVDLRIMQLHHELARTRAILGQQPPSTLVLEPADAMQPWTLLQMPKQQNKSLGPTGQTNRMRCAETLHSQNVKAEVQTNCQERGEHMQTLAQDRQDYQTGLVSTFRSVYAT